MVFTFISYNFHICRVSPMKITLSFSVSPLTFFDSCFYSCTSYLPSSISPARGALSSFYRTKLSSFPHIFCCLVSSASVSVLLDRRLLGFVRCFVFLLVALYFYVHLCHHTLSSSPRQWIALDVVSCFLLFQISLPISAHNQHRSITLSSHSHTCKQLLTSHYLRAHIRMYVLAYRTSSYLQFSGSFAPFSNV